MSRTTGAAWRELTLEEHMELVGGPVDGTVFKNEADRELAWRHHYDHLMERRGGQAGDRVWGFWRYELNVEEPATYLEKVLLLEKRGLLSEKERREIISHAEHARQAPPCQAFVSPRSAAESMKQMEREHKEEAIALLEALQETQAAGR